MTTSLRQVRKPTMKKRAVVTVMARVSVLTTLSSMKPGALMFVRVAGKTGSLRRWAAAYDVGTGARDRCAERLRLPE
jgi:hypothetical protein